MIDGDEVILGGCIVVEGELVGFLKGYRNYTIPNFVTKIGSNYAEFYRDTFEDDFVDPVFDMSELSGSNIRFNMPFKEWIAIKNIELLHFPISGW